MMISSKGRYALRVMLDLAVNKDDNYISLNEIAHRQQISLKYLEAIIRMLNKAGFVNSLRGVKGGYQLAKDPKDYTVGEIIRLTENGLSLVNCDGFGQQCKCDRASDCLTMPIWKNLDGLINSYLDNISLYDVINHDYKLIDLD